MVRFTALTHSLPLALALFLVGLTQARAESFEVRINGTKVACPTTGTAMPLQGTLPLPLGAMGAVIFDCDVLVPGEGAFEVVGTIRAIDTAMGAIGFNSTLAITATAVAQGPVMNPAGTGVFITVRQLYTVPVVVSTIGSNIKVDGACTTTPLVTATTGVSALFFNVDGAPNGLNPINNSGTGTPFFPCGSVIAAAQARVDNGNGSTTVVLDQTGTMYFAPGTTGGDAVTLQMQTVAFNSMFGGAGPFPLPPPTPPVVTMGTGEELNEFVPFPDPSTGFVMVFGGDVRGAIGIEQMRFDPLVNAFAYKTPFNSDASMGLDKDGNTVVLFRSDFPISNHDIFCYGGPCNNVPHFGVAASGKPCLAGTCGAFTVLQQYWTDDPANVFPSLGVSSPQPPGNTVSYTTVYADVTTGTNTVGQWFRIPSATNLAPLLTLCNNTAAGVATSNVGFKTNAIEILQRMNFGHEPPPGQPGSPFIPLSGLNGLVLPSGACVTVNPNPDIAVTTGAPTKQGTGLIVPVNLNNTGGTMANNTTISSVKPISPSTYVGPALPLTVGNIGAGKGASQNIQIDVTGLGSGSIARFQISGSFQDGAGNNFQYSTVRGVRVP